MENINAIKDIYKDGRNVYYTSSGELEYSSLLDKYKNEFNFVRVPSLTDKAKLESYPFSSDIYSRLSEKLREILGQEARISLSFKNAEKGFDRCELDNTEKSDAKENVSDKPAYIYNGDVDWDRLTCHSLHELICQRKDSTQKLVYITSDGEEVQTYGEIYETSIRMAASMKKAGIKKGDKAIFQFMSNKNFVESFWACMLIGVAAVPVGAVEDYTSVNVNTDKLDKICRTLDGSIIFCDREQKDKIGVFIDNYKLNTALYDAESFHGDEVLDEITGFDWEEPCLFLFTSGSTGIPKGVGLSQRNIFARHIGELQMYNYGSELSDFNWMTLSHGGGIIWSHIRDIYLDCFQVQCDTSVILHEPLKLMDYFSRFRTNISWTPNFAYAMAADAIDDDTDYGWDLSNAVSICSGGEGNVSRTLRKFIKKVRKYNFPENGLKPVFGMTETSSCMTYYDDFTLEKTSDSDKNVSIGTPSAGVEVRITDSGNKVLCEGETGYIQMKGEPIFKEYYRNPEANSKSFTDDGFFITGDLGFIRDNNIYITGREKDVIIINGLNYYIQDIEEAANNISGVKNGCTTIISVMEEGREKVILFITPENEELLNEANELRAFIKKVRREIQLKCFITPDHVVPIRSGDFYYTEIGKKMRNALKNDYVSGKFLSVIHSVEEIAYDYVLETVRTEMPLSNAGLDELSETAETVIDRSFAETDPEIPSDDFSVSNIEAAYLRIFRAVSRYADTQKPVRVIFPVIYDDSFSIVTYALNAVLKTLAIENENFSFRTVFMDSLDDSIIAAEAESGDGYETVIYKDGIRYIDAYKTRVCSCSADKLRSAAEEKVMVIIGGTGGIGKILTGYFAETYKSAKIAVIGRRSAEETADIISSYPADRVRYYSADVCSIDALRIAFDSIKKDFGADIGIIFNLAVKNIPKSDEVTIAELSEKMIHDIYAESAAVKLAGLRNLEQLRKENGAVVYSISSLTSGSGWKRMSAYASSNLLLESYSKFINEPDNRFISFGVWNDIGLNARKSDDDMRSFLDGFNEERLSALKGFNAEKGIRAIENIISSDTGSCMCGIDRNNRFIQHLICDSFESVVDIELPDASSKEQADKYVSSEYGFLKPYVRYTVRKAVSSASSGDSENSAEEKIRLIWEEVLGSSIESNDVNLFDIGGNSLSAFAISESVSKSFSVKIKPVDIMTYPTISSLAGFINESSSSAELSEKKDKKTARRRVLKNR